MDKQTFTTKLYEVCSNDELRPILMCVHFKDGYAYASDGHVLIKQSLDYHSIGKPELLDGKSMHKDNYKAIMQFEIAECDDNGVACSDNDGRTAYFEFFDYKGLQQPNFEATLKRSGFAEVSFIGINPEFLYKLSKAMHNPSGVMRLQFQGLDKPVLIDVVGIEDQYALIMPAVIQDTLFK